MTNPENIPYASATQDSQKYKNYYEVFCVEKLCQRRPDYTSDKTTTAEPVNPPSRYISLMYKRLEWL
jgi:hypothetical protein